MLNFGQRVKAIRKDAQMTQAELAEKLMVSVQSISKWECGNAMPDISQIVPLAAVLGVTTDCLLGVGGDEKSDRKALFAEAEKINKGIEKVYARQDEAYYACYVLYKEYIKKYPLDYEVKLLCADSLVRCIYYSTRSKEEKDKLYFEAVHLLKSVINYARDTTQVIDAKQTLIILYLYHDDFANAEKIAESLPQRGSIRAAMEIEICSKKNDYEKCIVLSEDVCSEAVHHYLWALAMRAKRLSLRGTNQQKAISAWHDLIDGVKFNYTKFHDIRIHTKWLYSALNNLANAYIALSEEDEALTVIEELADTLIHDYSECEDSATAAEIKSNFSFYLHSCYHLHFQTDDNVISNNPRFQECEKKLRDII